MLKAWSEKPIAGRRPGSEGAAAIPGETAHAIRAFRRRADPSCADGDILPATDFNCPPLFRALTHERRARQVPCLASVLSRYNAGTADYSAVSDGERAFSNTDVNSWQPNAASVCAVWP
jgi:hypothetical protein